MTWVLGSGTIFGYSALIADTRVTWDNLEYADVLQKIHYVGPQLLAGFAGSVELGFEMVSDMKLFYDIPKGNLWWPRIAALQWRRRGRNIFRNASKEKKAGCSLILAGIGPKKSFFGNFSYAIRMEHPEFEPKFIKRGIWTSIGSGKNHSLANEIAKAQNENPQKFEVEIGQGEAGMGRGGAAVSLAISVSNALRKNPLASVSESIVIGLIFASDYNISPLKVTEKVGTAQERQIAPNQLISNFNDFNLWCSKNGYSASCAVAKI